MGINDTWWVNPTQLDEDQKAVISTPIDKSYLVMGPPGSGKSNLLLLRAEYYEKAGHPNSIILAFTKQLQEFMKAGVGNYTFSENKIVTSQSFFFNLLREYDITYEFVGKFEKDRNNLINLVEKLISEKHISDIYEYILLDEAQDYLPEEIDIFYKLSKYLFAVADSRQKIYSGDDPISRIKDRVDNTYTLRYHYRNGVKICMLADGISKRTGEFESLVKTSNYDEKTAPSSVEISCLNTIEEQCEIILRRVQTQVKAYPNELIGIITPRNYELCAIIDFFLKSELYSDGLIQVKEDGSLSFDFSKPIVISTMHSAKGLEFRALHIAACENVKKFSTPRNLSYTGVTRAKTSLCIYHSDEIPPFFEQAIANIQRPPKLPDIEDLFKQER